MTLNLILQWVAVAIILIMALIYIVRKMRRNKGCGSCELKDKCDKLKK
ncbi:MAG: FeoB-associated Cys-rich membrane protein [Muribaculaceae bacterium]|nr:FeoB-associated Cys-rich membrane protein [Muribaculaceae bacterium]